MHEVCVEFENASVGVFGCHSYKYVAETHQPSRRGNLPEAKYNCKIIMAFLQVLTVTHELRQTLSK